MRRAVKIVQDNVPCTKYLFVKKKNFKYDVPKLDLSEDNSDVLQLNTRFYKQNKGLINNELAKSRADTEEDDLYTFEFKIEKFVNVYKEGDYFGQLALINNKPRAANIVCTSDCDFAVLSKNDYNQIIAESENKKLDKEVDFFKEFSYLKHLSKIAI